MEPVETGILIRGRPTVEATLRFLEEHARRVKAMGVLGPRLGELRKVYLEMEFHGEGAEWDVKAFLDASPLIYLNTMGEAERGRS